MKITTNQKTPLSGMSIQHQEYRHIELTPEEVDQIFWKRLNDISENMFMRDGFLWREIDMQGHGSDIDEKVAPIEDGPYNLAIQALRLKKAILDAAI